MFKLFLLALVALVSIGQVHLIKWKCDDKAEAQVDDIIAQLLVIGTVRKFPETKPGIKQFCSEQKELFAKADTYKDQCLKGQPKQIFSVLSYALKNALNRICKNANSKPTVELLEALPCANAGKGKFEKCNLDFINLLEVTKTLSDSKDKLAQLCCGYAALFGCFRGNLKQVKVCTPKRSDTLLDFLRAITDNAVNLICGDYGEASDKCDQVQLVKRKGKNSKNISKSFAKPLIYVLSNI